MRRKFSLGVCAMESKVENVPMRSILKRLEDSGDFVVVVFPEQMILEEEPSNWPVVECLIAFYSRNFPLEKAIEYVRLYNPVILNDLEKQRIIRSRVEIYRELQACRIPHPNYIIVDHQLVKQGLHTFEEHYDYIVYNGVRLNKPFVEKPVNSDDHNNWIYYPLNSGGGCKKLFRKIADRSSEYCPEIHNVRRDATYVYQEFVSSFGTDIKVYAVGPMFAHAEARKSPALDGKVDRYPDGKEIRYPVILTGKEKTIACRIVDHFRQIVCGFDILRTFDGPYVCDVNGWSFVKRNQKYLTDCSNILRIILLLKLQSKYNVVIGNIVKERTVGEEVIKKTFADLKTRNLYDKRREELCSVVVIMRHADRKPKNKLKFNTKNRHILAYFKGNVLGEIKLKSPEELVRLNETVVLVLDELQRELDSLTNSYAQLNSLNNEINALVTELECFRELKKMLDKGYEFSGINRKVQFKPLCTTSNSVNCVNTVNTVNTVSNVNTVNTVNGVNRVDGVCDDMTDSCSKSSAYTSETEHAYTARPVRKLDSVLIVAKWGGDLTDVGKLQAEDLGRRFRETLYPADCSGLIRLHSTFRHDFKIFSSDEGRCQITSAAFTKGILELEGDLTPILVTMTIRNKRAYELLNDTTISKQRLKCKVLLNKLITAHGTPVYDQVLRDIPEHDRYYYNKAIQDSEYKREDFAMLQGLIKKYISSLKKELMWNSLYSVDDYTFYIVNKINHTINRWNRLLNKFHKHMQSPNSGDTGGNTGSFQGSVQGTNTTNSAALNTVNTVNSTVNNAALGTNSAALNTVNTVNSTVNTVDMVNSNVNSGAVGPDTVTEYDYTKLSDIVDNIRYDLIHLHYLLGHGLEVGFEIYNIVERLSSVISPCEYGVTPREKLEIGVTIAWNLLQKILHDVTFHLLYTESINSHDADIHNSNTFTTEDSTEDTFNNKPVNHSNSVNSCNTNNNSVSSVNTVNSGNIVNTGDTCGDTSPVTQDVCVDRPIELRAINRMLKNDTSAASIAATSLLIANTYLNSGELFDAGKCFIGGLKPSEMYLFHNQSHTELLYHNHLTHTPNTCNTVPTVPTDNTINTMPTDNTVDPVDQGIILNSYSLWSHVGELCVDERTSRSVRGSYHDLGYKYNKSIDTNNLERDNLETNNLERDNLETNNLERDNLETDLLNLSLKDTPGDFITNPKIRSRFYVTSASHLFSVFNFFKYAHLLDDSFDTNSKQIENINDLHYLSHLVLRVWRSKGDEGYFNRLEILVSSGAKDGFGQNYELLEKNAKDQKNKYKRHIQRYRLQKTLTHRCTDCPITTRNFVAGPKFTFTNTKIRAINTVNRAYSLKSSNSSSDSAAIGSNGLWSKCVVGLTNSVVGSGNLSANSCTVVNLDKYNLMYEMDKKFKCYNCFLTEYKTARNINTVDKHLSTVDKVTTATVDKVATGTVGESESVRGVDMVPPYCELNTLVIMNRNFGLDRLKDYIQKAYHNILLKQPN